MHDIRFIRENPEAFDRGLERRGLAPQAQRLISIDERRRAIIRVNEGAQARRNVASKEIGQAKARKDEETAQKLMAEVAELKASISTTDVEQKAVEKELNDALAEIPNLPLNEVPDGKDEHDNVLHHRFGAKREFVLVREGQPLTAASRELIVHEAQSNKANESAVARKHGVDPDTLTRWLRESKDKVQKPHLQSEDTFAPKQHFELGEALAQMDFESAAKLSGARFVVLKGGLARLERALGQFMLDVHTSEPHYYTEVSPPLLVRDEVMFGTAQLPKFEDDQFYATRKSELDPATVEELRICVDGLFSHQKKIEKFQSDLDSGALGTDQNYLKREIFAKKLQMTNIESRMRAIQNPDRLWLVPTAEVPLTNLVRESIVDEAQLPMRLTACTPCFRAEAGAAGKDTRGMIRQHQFTKVELVSVTTPEQSKDEHERMLACAEEILRRLDLHYRVVTLCAGDMGFASQKTYDIEVWLPGQNMYREISSCSVCGEFQARRMNARYRTREGRHVRHVHTLNGSGVAGGRALIAVMETYQQEDGSIAVPDALLSYMGGMTKITN
jgi:seryl-tRNA synthetase